MSKNGEMSYSARLAMAQIGGNNDAVGRIICEAFSSITQKLNGVVTSYDPADMPIIVAAMLVHANAIKGALPDGGKGIVDNLVSHTTMVSVNAEELRRQAREEKKE